MDLSKHLEFYNPVTNFKDEIHIIGVGAGGSTLCMLLTRLGFPKIHIYDFDIVTAHNIANQMFDNDDIGCAKTLAVKNNCIMINPDINIVVHDKGWSSDDTLAGYVFLCVDSIELRKQIAEENKFNPNIKAMFDHRMRFSDCQHYAAVWSDKKQKENFIKSMNFTDEEARAQTPVSACGTTLSILPTVLIMASYSISNFLNYLKKNELKNVVLMDSFGFDVLAM